MVQKKNDIQHEVQAKTHVMQKQDLNLEGGDYTPVSASCFAEYIRTLRQNGRQGTVGCKDRSEVAFSNKKPWKQKGTGRARAGSRRSPLWRKGGVIFGPQPRTRMLHSTQNMRRSVMRTLLFEAIAQERVVVLACDLPDKPSTSHAMQVLRSVNLHDKKVVLFTELHDEHVHASFVNIPTVRLALFDQPNGLLLADTVYWLYLQKDANMFKKMVQQWI